MNESPNDSDSVRLLRERLKYIADLQHDLKQESAAYSISLADRWEAHSQIQAYLLRAWMQTCEKDFMSDERQILYRLTRESLENV